MEPAGLLSLPEEMLQHISSYMTVTDVLSCSLTCHYLRSALNHNCVWRRYLPEQDMSQLKLAEQQVQPVLQLDDSITPLCDKRLLYIRRTRLINNWRGENCVEHSSKLSSAYSRGVFNPCFKGIEQLIYKDRYLFVGLFINDVGHTGIDVWDVKNVPVLKSSLELTYKYYTSCYRIIGNYLLIIKCHKVDVYQITLPETEFPLVFSFLITDERVTLHEHVYHAGRCVESCEDWDHYIAGQYLMSNKCGEPQCIFHVWDISNACKVGSFLLPITGQECSSIGIHSFVRNEWFLRQEVQSNRDTYYFKFNIEKGTFSDSVFKPGYNIMHLLYYNSHIITFRYADNSNSLVWYDTVCTVYDFDTSVELKKRRFNDANRNSQINSTKIYNGVFIVLCFDCFQIIDALTLETVDHFQCDDVHYILQHFNILGSLFVVAKTVKNRLEVWDINNKKKMPKYLLNEYSSTNFYLSESLSKLIFFNVHCIGVLHFW